MIDAMFVYDAIGKVVNRFKKSQLHIRRHYYEVKNEDGECWEFHYYIEDEVKHMLDGLNIQNDVRLIDMRRATGFDVMVLAISFVVEGELHTIDFIVEGECY